MGRILLSPEEKENRAKRVIELFNTGASRNEIQKNLHMGYDSITKILLEAGLLVHSSNQDGSRMCAQTSATHSMKEQQKITWQMIEDTRDKIHIGDRIRILTEKASVCEGAQCKASFAKWATVVSKENRRFCLVRIEANGVIDSILWSDICIAMRNGEEIVG